MAFCLLLITRFAWAGTYLSTTPPISPILSANPPTSRYHSDQTSGNRLYGPATDGSFGGGGGCSWGVKDGPNGTRVSYHGDADADSEIKAHFVWKPDYEGEPPPQSVIIYQSAKAWYIDGASTCGHGRCTTPFDHEVDTPIPVFGGFGLPPLIIGHIKTSYRYTVKQNPGTSFDLTCTPTAHLEGDGVVGTGGTNDQGGAGGIGVSYGTKVANVEMNFSGTLKISDEPGEYLMVGQGLKASLSCDFCTFDDWSWQLKGGVPFSGWYADNLSTSYYPWDSEIQEQLHVYFTIADKVTVSCTAVATFPDGTSDTVSATKDVLVSAPIVGSNFAVAGDVFISPTRIYTAADPHNSDDPEPENNVTHGITWYEIWDTPSPFKMA